MILAVSVHTVRRMVKQGNLRRGGRGQVVTASIYAMLGMRAPAPGDPGVDLDPVVEVRPFVE